jgi:hypothetical protein
MSATHKKREAPSDEGPPPKRYKSQSVDTQTAQQVTYELRRAMSGGSAPSRFIPTPLPISADPFEEGQQAHLKKGTNFVTVKINGRSVFLLVKDGQEPRVVDSQVIELHEPQIVEALAEYSPIILLGEMLGDLEAEQPIVIVVHDVAWARDIHIYCQGKNRRIAFIHAILSGLPQEDPNATLSLYSKPYATTPAGVKRMWESLLVEGKNQELLPFAANWDASVKQAWKTARKGPVFEPTVYWPMKENILVPVDGVIIVDPLAAGAVGAGRAVQVLGTSAQVKRWGNDSRFPEIKLRWMWAVDLRASHMSGSNIVQLTTICSSARTHMSGVHSIPWHVDSTTLDVLQELGGQPDRECIIECLLNPTTQKWRPSFIRHDKSSPNSGEVVWSTTKACNTPILKVATMVNLLCKAVSKNEENKEQ